MTSWFVKQAVALGVFTLVGCTTPAAASLPPTASLAQPLASADKGPDVPLLDQTPPPRVADVSLNQRGRASWYGKKFNGQRTASGERFSASGFTAAHRTLPFNSYVRVRRVASGEEVIVRITDRGPFHLGRVLDLSHAAAERIGLVALGGAEVEIEPLTEYDRRLESPPMTLPTLNE
jgi:rare lipoprotein A